MPKENRRYQRINIRVPVQLTLSSGKVLTMTSVNLSGGGIAVGSEAPADSGTQFTLSFPVSAGIESKSIRVVAEVVHQYLSRDNNGYVIGMAFVQISEAERLLVDSYVKSIDRIRS